MELLTDEAEWRPSFTLRGLLDLPMRSPPADVTGCLAPPSLMAVR